MTYDYTDFNFTFYRGTSEDLDITFTSDLAGTTPINITGWTVWCTAKLSLDDADTAAIFQRTTTNGGVAIIDGPGGKARITILPANTDALTDAKTTLVADVQGKSPTGRIATPVTGKFIVVAEVTRSTT